MDEVLWLSAYLPQPAVGLFPPLSGRIDQVQEEAPIVIVGRVTAPVPAPGHVHHLPVGVELKLVGGGVANAHGFCPPVAFQLLEHRFGKAAPAPHAVHDLQLFGVTGRAALYEALESLGLRGEADLGQRAHAEGGVSDPTVAVIPVAAPPRGLGQRGSGGGRDGPRRGVGEPFKGHSRTYGAGSVWAIELGLRGPPAPPFNRLLKAAVQLVRMGHLGWIVVQNLWVYRDNRDANPLAGPHRKRSFQIMVSRRGKLWVSRDHERAIPADDAIAIGFFVAQPRLELSVIEPWRYQQVQVDAPPDPLNDAQQLSTRISPSALAHSETVEQAGFSATRCKPGLKHQRVVADVVTRGVHYLLFGVYGAESALFPVEQARKATVAIYPGHAAPVY